METEEKTAGLESGKEVGTTPVVSNEGGVANVTPAAPSSDDGSKARLEKLEAELKAREDDINKLKSSYDKKLNETQRKYQEEQRRLQEEIRNARLATMTDEQKKQFEVESKLEEAEQWKQRAQTYEQQMQEQKIAADYMEYFKSIGVPPEKLVVNQGLDTLVQSGWNGLQEVITGMKTKLSQYESKTSQPTQEQTPAQEQPAEQHSPITTNPVSTTLKKSWADIDKEYKEHGGLSYYFDLVEQGKISPVPPGK